MEAQQRGREWQELTAAVRTVRADLLEADASYVESEAADKVMKRLAPYFDPARHRAQVIRDYANGLSVEVAAFDGVRARLLEPIAVLTLNLEATSLAIAQAGLAEIIGHMSRIYPDRSVPEQTAAIGHRLEVLEDIGRQIGCEYVWVLRLTERLILLRQAELEALVAKTPQRDPGSCLRAFLSVAAEEGVMGIGAEVFKDVVVGSIPVASVVVGFVEIARGLREKVRAMEDHYEAGPIDRMFELAERTIEERELIDCVASVTDAANDSFLAITAALNHPPPPALGE